MSTSRPSIGFPRSSTSGHAVVELTSSRIDSPPRRVGNRKSSHDNDGADVVHFRPEGISVDDLKHVGLRTFFLESTEVLMYILTISEGTLQSEPNRFCSHKARSLVNNDRFEDLVSAADLASMCSLKVIVDRCEVLEERDVEVVLIGVRLHRQKPVIDGVRVERVTRRRVGFLDLLLFISIDIPSDWTARRQRCPPSYPASKGDMRYFEVPRRRTNSGAPTKGKRLAYSSFDEWRAATRRVASSKSWYPSRQGPVW